MPNNFLVRLVTYVNLRKKKYFGEFSVSLTCIMFLLALHANGKNIRRKQVDFVVPRPILASAQSRFPQFPRVARPEYCRDQNLWV
ncbi:unnamed protein product [Ixodes pacificus]